MKAKIFCIVLSLGFIGFYFWHLPTTRLELFGFFCNIYIFVSYSEELLIAKGIFRPLVRRD